MGSHEFFQRKIKARDGIKNKISFYPGQTGTTGDSQTPVFLILPAMGVRASYYKPLAQNLARLGNHAVTADLRGHGESRIRPSHFRKFGYYEMVHYDWPAYIEGIRAVYPDNPIILLGHSLGGQLSALYAAVDPQQIAAVITIASCNIYYRGFPKPMKLLAAINALRLSAEILGFMPGKLFGFGGTESKQMIRDWSRNGRTGQYRFGKDKLNYDRMLARLKLPVLTISFADDPFSPKLATDKLYRKFLASPSTRWHLQSDEIADVSINHFNWIRHSEILCNKINDWVQKVPSIKVPSIKVPSIKNCSN